LKRLTAIFFLLIFLFNTGGYYLAFWAIKQHAKENLLERLNASQYSKEESVVFTIPFSLPYPVSDGSYERVHGDFEYGGEYYKLVKQKLVNDTLFIVCVKDKETKHIEETLSDYSKSANNLPIGAKQAFNFLSKLFKDFHSETEITISAATIVVQTKAATRSITPVVQPHYSIDTPPPEVFML
jgi:hypothetical protein